MKSSGDNGKGGEGRGLPRGWGWREDTGSLPPVVSSYLYAPGADDYNAGAYNDGAWVAYSGESRAEMVDEYDPAPGGPYSPALLAAAQAAAEAALWRRDGFGVGEVRGVRVPFAFEGLDDRMTRELPGLSGRWTISKWRDAEGGGVEVDAVRAPVPVDKVARAWASISQIGDDGSHPADAVRAAVAADPCPECAGSPWPTCLACGKGYPGKGEPAPSRESSAPTDDGELARLLRGPDGARLDDDIATVRNHAPEIWSGTREHVLRVARACALLLAERERMADTAERSFTIGAGEIDKRQHAERERDALRARVAELEEMVEGGDREARNQRDRADEAERKLSAVAAEWKEMDASLSEAKEQLRIVSAGPDDVWRWAGDGGDDPASLACPVVMSAETLREFVAARERVAALEATPPPGTVAALLARVEEARRKAGTLADEEEGRAVMDRSIISYDRGRARGLQDAARFVREWASAEPAADGATIAEARRDERRLCIADMRGEIDGAAERAYMERVGARINRRATLTPSPLDAVAAEVCALPVEMPTFYASVDSVEDGLHAVDMLIGDHELPRRDRLARIARVALTGMLACDAAPVPAGPRCRHCSAALGAEHTADCVVRVPSLGDGSTIVTADWCGTTDPDHCGAARYFAAAAKGGARG